MNPKDYIAYNLFNILGVSEITGYRETFIDQQYRWLYDRIKPNTTVMDIGAATGDTAIYFGMHPNAKRIYSWEPDKGQYNKFMKNAMKCKNRDIKNLTGFNKCFDWNDIKTAEMKTVAIKCDCEGAEFDIFDQNAPLDNVYAIMLEFHNQGVGQENLIINALLEKGYEVEVKDKHYGAQFKHGIGMICAERVQ